MENKLTRQAITDEIKKLALETVTVTDGGEYRTRVQQLVQIIWDRALGYTDKDKDGKEHKVKPAKWAIDMIYDRLEGKVPLTTDESVDRPKAAEKVTEVAKKRINKFSIEKE